MRRLIWKFPEGETVADLGDDGIWTCESELMERALRSQAAIRLPELRPQEGDPLAVLLAEAGTAFEADDVINDPPGDVPRGIQP